MLEINSICVLQLIKADMAINIPTKILLTKLCHIKSQSKDMKVTRKSRTTNLFQTGPGAVKVHRNLYLNSPDSFVPLIEFICFKHSLVVL